MSDKRNRVTINFDNDTLKSLCEVATFKKRTKSFIVNAACQSYFTEIKKGAENDNR